MEKLMTIYFVLIVDLLIFVYADLYKQIKSLKKEDTAKKKLSENFDLSKVRSRFAEMDFYTWDVFTNLFFSLMNRRTALDSVVTNRLINSLSLTTEKQTKKFSFLRILKNANKDADFKEVIDCAIDDILVSISQGKF